MFSWHSPLVILWGNAWKMQRLRARENYRKTFRKISYSSSFSWCWITCDERRVFLEFTEGEQWICHSFSDIRKCGIMRNFPVVHHFGKLTVNVGFCAVKAIYDGYNSLQCREVYKNTTLVLLRPLFVQDRRAWALFILISKNGQFCYITFPKKAHILN